MRVLLPARVLDKHIGGNSTYARALQAGLSERGISTGKIMRGPHPAVTAILETLRGLGGRADTVLHYTADTGPAVKTRVPSVLTLHGVASRWTPVARNQRQERLWRARVRRAITSTDTTITVSESAADDISHVFGVAREKIRIIPHGIDIRRNSTPSVLSPAVAERLPADFALYVGNIEPRKNIVELVRAFDSPVLRNSGVPLVIAGRLAWNYQETAEAMNEARNVIYLGFVDECDRVALMQKCKLFVFPSLYEGFGFPVLEAMAAGSPVAASRRGSLAEIAGPAYELSDLSAEGLAGTLDEALRDDDWQKGSREPGREWAKSFSWPVSIEKHIDVYREAMLTCGS